MEVDGAAAGAPEGGGESGLVTETSTAAVRVAAPRRYHAGASEGLTRRERRKLAKAKKKAAR